MVLRVISGPVCCSNYVLLQVRFLPRSPLFSQLAEASLELLFLGQRNRKCWYSRPLFSTVWSFRGSSCRLFVARFGSRGPKKKEAQPKRVARAVLARALSSLCRARDKATAIC